MVLSLFIVSFPVGGVLPAGGGAGVSTLPHGVGARGLKQSQARLGLAEVSRDQRLPSRSRKSRFRGASCRRSPCPPAKIATPQDFLLGLSKQAIAPIERGTHRVMSWQSRASAARQQPHSVVEAISEPLNSIKRRRGLLQTRSQAKFRPILTDFSDDRGVRIGKLEFVHCRRRALHEQSAGKLRASAAESCLAVRGLSQGDRRCTCSPSVRNGSRLVARTCTPGAP